MRYQVTEVEGYARSSPGGNALPGLSCVVIDTLAGRRMMAQYRTEDRRGKTRGERVVWVREQAALAAERLNAA